MDWVMQAKFPSGSDTNGWAFIVKGMLVLLWLCFLKVYSPFKNVKLRKQHTDYSVTGLSNFLAAGGCTLYGPQMPSGVQGQEAETAG